MPIPSSEDQGDIGNVLCLERYSFFESLRRSSGSPMFEVLIAQLCTHERVAMRRARSELQHAGLWIPTGWYWCRGGGGTDTSVSRTLGASGYRVAFCRGLPLERSGVVSPAALSGSIPTERSPATSGALFSSPSRLFSYSSGIIYNGERETRGTDPTATTTRTR